MNSLQISIAPGALADDVMSAMPSPTNVPTIPVPPAKPLLRVHTGIRAGGPAWVHNIAGIPFPQTTSLYDDAGTEFKKVGTVVEMDIDQLRLVRDGVRRRVVRWTYGITKTGERKKVSAEIWDTTTGGFRPSPGDEPLEPYLIFEILKEESIQPALGGEVLRAMDEALANAQKSEQKAQQDPRDARTRGRHGEAKATGSKLSDEDVT
jgi:hypothetical protein